MPYLVHLQHTSYICRVMLDPKDTRMDRKPCDHKVTITNSELLLYCECALVDAPSVLAVIKIASRSL
jgi:hypothetical protein